MSIFQKGVILPSIQSTNLLINIAESFGLKVNSSNVLVLDTSGNITLGNTHQSTNLNAYKLSLISNSLSATVNGNNIISGDTTQTILGNINGTTIINGTNFQVANTGAITGSTLTCSGNVSGGTITTGAITGTSLLCTGNVSGGTVTTGDITGTSLLCTGNVSGGTVTTGAITGTSLLCSGNVSGGTVTTGAITGTSLLCSGNVSGGTVTTGAITGTSLLCTGNVSGGTVTTGDITGTSLLCSGNVSGGTITTGAITGTSLLCTGNVSGGTVTTGAITGTSLSCTGNVGGATVTSSGSITGTSLSCTGNVGGATVTSSGSITGTSLSCTGNISGNSFTYTGNTIDPDSNTSILPPTSWIKTNFATTASVNVSLSNLSSSLKSYVDGKSIDTTSSYTWTNDQTFNSTVNAKGTLNVGINNTDSTVGSIGGIIKLAGTFGDTGDECRIYTRLYGTTEKSELVLYKGNDSVSSGPDRIRFCASQFVFDLAVQERNPNSTTTNIKMMMDTNGNIGIGTETPSYNLDVTGTIRSTGTITGDSFSYSGSDIAPESNTNILATTKWVQSKLSAITINTGQTYNWSVIQNFNQGIKSSTINSTGETSIGNNSSLNYIYGSNINLGGGTDIYLNTKTTCNSTINAVTFNSTSDKRVKTHIEDLNSESSLQIIRQLKPKKYDFMDTHQDQLGFIAQDVKEIDVLSPAVNVTGKGFIPNIVRTVTCYRGWFSLDYPLKISDRIQYKYLDKVETTTIIDSSNHLFHMDVPIHGEVFLYGTEIEDLHSIQKDMIFTLAVSALQRLDEIVTKQQTMLDAQQKMIDILLEKIK